MKFPTDLSSEAEQESYVYFDQLVSPLPKGSDGKINLTKVSLQDNEIDAFRHAYVSGIFTHEYGEAAAKLAGWLNEKTNFASGRSDENMDLWNNSVGRRLAKKYRTKDALAAAIRDALRRGELITSPSDSRRYEEAESLRAKGKVVVIGESKTGANEFFFDLETSVVMSRLEFVAQIERGKYPDYFVRRIAGEPFPAAKSDSSTINNLG